MDYPLPLQSRVRRDAHPKASSPEFMPTLFHNNSQHNHWNGLKSVYNCCNHHNLHLYLRVGEI